MNSFWAQNCLWVEWGVLRTQLVNTHRGTHESIRAQQRLWHDLCPSGQQWRAQTLTALQCIKSRVYVALEADLQPSHSLGCRRQRQALNQKWLDSKAYSVENLVNERHNGPNGVIATDNKFVRNSPEMVLSDLQSYEMVEIKQWIGQSDQNRHCTSVAITQLHSIQVKWMAMK